jgi:two-component system sensor histidine kinase KdpD
MPTDRRPNPEDLLKTVQKEEAQSSEGRLYVFFGMCPGVGKTYAMLEAAHAKKKIGHDIVIGFVETHGRSETQKLTQDIELIPRKKVSYKGANLEELDLDEVLKRKPEIVLVDELAHTNASECRHAKRYQDVEEILKAGIDVYTTMNVQHLESRADLVTQITGSPIRETVPDSFLQKADQIEILDVTPDDLLKRLKEGKVYLGERAEAASKNFFRIENLTALRELALRFTAEKVDHQLRDQMSIKQIIGPWNTNERLLVAISHSPYSARLIRSARRMAFNLEAPWIALYVDQGNVLDDEDQKTLTKNINLAKELGAEVVATREQDVSEAIKRVCEERNVTQIVMGRPDRRFLRDLFAKGNLLDRLVRETGEIDVHVVRQERKPKYIGFHLKFPHLRTGFIAYWYTLWFLFGVSFGSYALSSIIGYRAVGFIFLLAVLIIASLASKGPIIFAGLLSVFTWNFFFIPPKFTFEIREPEDIMMCLSYLIVATVAGYLANRIKRQDEDLKQREFRSNVLYEFGKNISGAKENKNIVERAQESIEKLFDAKLSIFVCENDSELSPKSLNYNEQEITENTMAVAHWSFKNKKKAGWSTTTLASSPCLSLPLIGKTKAIGVLLFFPQEIELLTIDQEVFLDSLATHLATTLERNLLEKEAKENFVLRESEKLHQALLNSVSHELKTPITSIIGASSALLDKKTVQQPETREMLLNDVIFSSQRLNRVVENLLDMSRISSGVLQIKKELFEVNDFVSSFLQRNLKFFGSHKIEFKEADDVYVEGDDRLLEHVLMNLISNAAAYSQAGTLIQIKILFKGSQVEIQVIDEGSGLAAEKLENIFKPFYRIPGTPTGGTGLGLTICKSIVDAHGGSVSAQNRTDRTGSIFVVSLRTESLVLNQGEVQ